MSAASRDLTPAIDRLTARLLARRVAGGHWEGRLASSALSTATACIALVLHARAGGGDHDRRVQAGLAWLVMHQNADGGWGDTPESRSNLSTTVLCWSALGLTRSAAAVAVDAAIRRADAWIASTAGSLDAASLKRAILARYGKDLTFSAPILTVLAICGRLGEGRAAWRLVPQLPFELAACPHRWFKWIRLPVVSYALPALVAIGQVRHHQAPTRNPVLAAIRSRLVPHTLAVARGMQPDSGGYLEAVPLTAFVVMSLVSAGRGSDAIVSAGVRFLAQSARSDGSWPIDTNLATWVTTQSVKVLAGTGALTEEDRIAIRRWLLGQQVTAEHPFTRATPGGWAWTDLSGGVPDADDTSGALVALAALGGERPRAAVAAGITWLLDLQNRDGGIPTFCRGWGALPFDRSAPDLTAHALEAWAAWRGDLDEALARRVARATARATAYLVRSQRADGSWVPLWFGNELVEGETNPAYGTARVVAGLSAAAAPGDRAVQDALHRGTAWLVAAQNTDGGWGGGPGAPSSIEETGVVLQALGRVAGRSTAIREAAARGTGWLISATPEGQDPPAAPIGFYFAKLWYSEELYPLAWGLGGLVEARAALPAASTTVPVDS